MYIYIDCWFSTTHQQIIQPWHWTGPWAQTGTLWCRWGGAGPPAGRWTGSWWWPSSSVCPPGGGWPSASGDNIWIEKLSINILSLYAWFQLALMTKQLHFHSWFVSLFRCFHDTKDRAHLINAGKYSTTFFVAIFSVLDSAYSRTHIFFNPLFFCYIGAMVVNSTYNFLWDITRDWGLFSSHSIPIENRLYPSQYFYYFGVMEDFILRFSWVMFIPLQFHFPYYHEIIVTVFTSLEVTRRFIWNFFR